jgi:hypothetical protein
METKGLTVSSSYLHGTTPQNSAGYGAVPLQFWSRLKHQAGLVGQLDAFVADYRATRDGIVDNGWSARAAESDAERAIFRRWVKRLNITLPASLYGDELWPWSAGWTDELVDSYLQPPRVKP